MELQMAFDDLKSKFEVFFREHYYPKLLKAVHEKGPLVVDFADLEHFDTDLADTLLLRPLDVFRAIDEAIAGIDVAELQQERLRLAVRFRNLSPTHISEIRNLRSAHIGHLIAVKGIIKQASEVRPEITEAVFECQICTKEIRLLQDGARLKKPRLCACGNRVAFDLKSRKLIDIQRIIIEESPDTIEGGTQPRKIAIFLRNDLVDPKFQRRVVPGNKVLVIGVLNDVPIRVEGKEESKRREIYIDGNWTESIEVEFEEIEINPEDEIKIKELAKNPQIYELLIKSIAQSIFGYEEVKEAIALQLFGGLRKVRPDGVITRGDIHVFLVGDPGTAKSQILKYVSQLAPKARYVVGKSASGAGITATVVKDEFMRGWALEAGALVLTNKGLCAIDELDKMSPEDRVAMHEAMEQQTVTISKANIQATLLAQTTILAAANPKFGRFDAYAPIAEQIDLPPTLLNRFDLIFSMRDIPNTEKDTKLVRHVLRLHESPQALDTPISPDLLRKYVAYVKMHCHPRLTKEAEQEIEHYYVGLRNRYATEESQAIPISPRQLEGLIRISEASARIRLSDVVTAEDAKRAIRLLTTCLQQVALDVETGRLDIDRVESGVTTAQRNKIRTIINTIAGLQAETEDKSAAIEDVLAAAENAGIDTAHAEEMIEKLKREGTLFEPKRGRIRKV